MTVVVVAPGFLLARTTAWKDVMDDSPPFTLDCIPQGVFGTKFLVTAPDKRFVGRITLIGFNVADTLIEYQDKLYTICRGDTLTQGRWLLVDENWITGIEPTALATRGLGDPEFNVQMGSQNFVMQNVQDTHNKTRQEIFSHGILQGKFEQTNAFTQRILVTFNPTIPVLLQLFFLALALEERRLNTISG